MLAIALSGLLTLLFIVFLKQNAARLGLVDKPGGRKIHTSTTPVIGGIAVFLGSGLALLLNDFTDTETLATLGICFMLVSLGALDDVLDLSAKKRLLAHLSAGLVMIFFCGERISGLEHLLPLPAATIGYISIPLTVLSVAAAINAFNLSDGVDGLAGSIALGTLLVLGFAANTADDTKSAIFCSVLIVSLLIFLAFNFRFPWRKQAEIFLGDAGSTFLGFVLVWLAIRISNNGGFSSVVTLWLFAVPVTDTISVIIKRRLSNRPIFSGGRDHLHHLLLARGYSASRVAITISSISTIVGIAGVLLDKINIDHGILLMLGVLTMLVQLLITLKLKGAELTVIVTDNSKIAA